MIASELLRQLPPISEKQKNIIEALIAYGAWIKFDNDAKNYLSTNNIKEIDNIVKRLIRSYNLFITGQISKSYKNIYNIFFSSSCEYSLFNSYEVNCNTFFFRMRSTENNYLFSKEEIFHIPFQERHKTSNQRFSLTGYPCLYLGKSIYGCWEELNRPKFETSNTSGLKNTRPLNLLDLRMPNDLNDVKDFYRLPFIIASSINVQHPEYPFKPEYIISQGILHSIITHNNSKINSNNFDGIIYYSSKINSNQRLFDDLDLFENIIVPTVNNIKNPRQEQIFQDGYCPVLCNTFKITKPISFNIFQLQKDTNSLSKDSANTNAYSRSQMAILEKYIKNLDTYFIEPNKFFRSRPELLKNY